MPKRTIKNGWGLSIAQWLETYATLVVRDPVTGCWDWPFMCDSDGYARKYMEGKTSRLARIVLAHKLGRPIADGQLALHTCDNPACVNGDHLYEGNNSANMIDRSRRQRHPVGAKAARAKLTEQQVTEIKALLISGKFVREIEPLFPVSRAQLYRIKGGEHWAQPRR